MLVGNNAPTSGSTGDDHMDRTGHGITYRQPGVHDSPLFVLDGHVVVSLEFPCFHAYWLSPSIGRVVLRQKLNKRTISQA